MIVYAVYFVDKKGYTISKTFQSTYFRPDEDLIGGLFTALQGMSEELISSDAQLNVIQLDNLFYHIKNFGMMRTIIVTNSPNSPDKVLETLGLKFLKSFSEYILNHNSKMIPIDKLNEFIECIAEILKNNGLNIDETSSINPIRKLTTADIYNLPKELKKIALAVLTLNQGSLEEISNESKSSFEFTQKKLEELTKLGFIGKKEDRGEKIYFCSL